MSEARDGWARVKVSSWDDDKESDYLAAVKEGTEVARVFGEFFIDVPVSVDAQQEAMENASTTFTIADGSKIKVKGPQAPAARKYYADAFEPVRGELREMGADNRVPDADTLQGMLDSASPYTGRGGRKAKTVSESKLDELAEMTPEELGREIERLGLAKVTT